MTRTGFVPIFMRSTMGLVKQMVQSEAEMIELGKSLGLIVRGGDVIELIGDVGAGKTTFTKGLALGLGVSDPVQSPTYTISREYDARDGLELRHYDFYRLNEAGIMSSELSESIGDDLGVTVVEWSGVVEDILPADRLQINIVADGENSRVVSINPLGDRSKQLMENLG